MINLSSPGDTLQRYLQRPDMMAPSPPAVLSVSGGPRAANATTQFSMELANNAVSTNFQGRVSLLTLAIFILLFMAFTYWTRGYQL